MALHWSWAFGPESGTDLTTMGFNATGGATATANAPFSDADKVYSYTGSPTRYSWGMYFNIELYVPAAAHAGVASGWITAAFKSGNAIGTYLGGWLIYGVTSGGRGFGVQVSSGGVLTLYVNGFAVGTSAAYDFGAWRYVALRFDLTGADVAGTHSGQVFVDGVEAIALSTSSRFAETISTLRTVGSLSRNMFPTTPDPNHYIAQWTIWNALADTQAATPVFVTRAEPTADGTNIGTWLPSTGSDDFAVVDSPFDTATYTQDASPSASDRCEVVTSTIATALGVTPGTVAGVTAHTFSEGQAVTARAVVGPSSGAEANGSSTAISASSTSYAMATSTATFAGSDTIDLIYEVVST